MKRTFTVTALAAAALLTAACDNDGPMEEAGEELDEAVDNLEDAAEDADG